MPEPTERAPIGVIGGSGLYALLESPQRVRPTTRFGEPSDDIVLGSVPLASGAGGSGAGGFGAADAGAGGEVAVAFLPRHGADHRYPPHRIPYRANLLALHQLGVRQVLAPCAVGSLRPELRPGTLVVPDQLVDRTSGRVQTLHDGPHVVHVAFADPYCPQGRAAVVAGSAAAGWPAVDGGTMVVVEGPRFSTRAESSWFAAQGWALVNMTGHPEALFARELGMCYTALALVTDLDAGIDGADPVTHAEVFATFAAATERLRALLLDHLVPALGALPADCRCRHSLDGLVHDLW